MGVPILNEMIQVILSHPILAFGLLIVVLSADAGIGVLGGFNGVVGSLITFFLNVVGIKLSVSSAQLLFVLAFSYLGLFCLKRIDVS